MDVKPARRRSFCGVQHTQAEGAAGDVKMDEAGIKAFLADYKAGKLERKQLS